MITLGFAQRDFDIKKTLIGQVDASTLLLCC